MRMSKCDKHILVFLSKAGLVPITTTTTRSVVVLCCSKRWQKSFCVVQNDRLLSCVVQNADKKVFVLFKTIGCCVVLFKTVTKKFLCCSKRSVVLLCCSKRWQESFCVVQNDRLTKKFFPTLLTLYAYWLIQTSCSNLKVSNSKTTIANSAIFARLNLWKFLFGTARVFFDLQTFHSSLVTSFCFVFFLTFSHSHILTFSHSLLPVRRLFSSLYSYSKSHTAKSKTNPREELRKHLVTPIVALRNNV